jgi:hypothetical protein
MVLVDRNQHVRRSPIKLRKTAITETEDHERTRNNNKNCITNQKGFASEQRNQ